MSTRCRFVGSRRDDSGCTSIAVLRSGTPQDVLYGPTNARVLKFSEGLAAEYRADGVHCPASMPGFTDTATVTVARQAYAAVMAGRVSIVHSRHPWSTTSGRARDSAPA